VDLEDLPAYLERLKKAAAGSASPAANAMADLVRHQIQNVALKQVAHAPGMFWKAAPMRPPAYASGVLSRSVVMRPASTAVKGSASVSVMAKYAAIQEFGGKTWPSSAKYMQWVNTGGEWFKKEVTIPQHPYFRPTVDRLIRSGELQRAAKQAFWVRVLPFFNG
jgi:phage gpG-like protein